MAPNLVALSRKECTEKQNLIIPVPPPLGWHAKNLTHLSKADSQSTLQMWSKSAHNFRIILNTNERKKTNDTKNNITFSIVEHNVNKMAGIAVGSG